MVEVPRSTSDCYSQVAATFVSPTEILHDNACVASMVFVLTSEMCQSEREQNDLMLQITARVLQIW